MTYSFTIRAASKSALVDAVFNEFDAIITAQPNLESIRQRDETAMVNALRGFKEMEGEDIEISMERTLPDKVWMEIGNVPRET